MSVEFHLSKEIVYALLGSGVALAAKYTLGILKKLSEDIIIKKIKGAFSDDISNLQNRLFGIGNDFAVLRGRTKWKLRGSDNEFFGDDIPIYDWIGLSNLAAIIPGFDYFDTKGEDYFLKGNFNLLSVGGPDINPYVNSIQRKYLPYIPFQFVDLISVLEKYRPETKLRAPRVYQDLDSGKIYTKDETFINKLIVDVTDKKRPPFGPFYTEEGFIKRDVLLITILPSRRGKKIILVTPGHGSGCRIADVICSSQILNNIINEIDKKQPHSFLQALFIVPVEMDNKEEIYGEPDLWEVRGLLI